MKHRFPARAGIFCAVFTIIGGCVEPGPEPVLEQETAAIRTEVSAAAYTVTEYHWGSGTQSEVATRLSFRFDQSTTCDWQMATVSGRAEPGLNAVVVMRPDEPDGWLWMAYTNGAGIHVEIASQEMPDFFFYSLAYADITSGVIGAKEFLTVDFFGKELNYQLSQFSPGHALAYSIYCDHPFVVDPVWAGDEVSLINADALNGTVVEVLGGTQVIVDGTFNRDIHAGHSGFWMASGDNTETTLDLGDVELTYPAGFESWSLNTSFSLVHRSAGAGNYDLRVNRIADEFAARAWWCVLYGMSEQIPPDVAGLPSTAIVY